MRKQDNMLLYFIRATKFYKRFILTQFIISFFAILCFADWKMAMKIWNWFWLINFWWTYLILCAMIFMEEIANTILSMRWIVRFDFWDPGDDVTYNTDRIDWISIDDLILLILENKWLPTTATKEAFNINNEQLKKLWDNLERVGILKRWKNNARILKIDDYDMMKDIIWWIVDSNDLYAPLVKLQEWIYQYKQ